MNKVIFVILFSLILGLNPSYKISAQKCFTSEIRKGNIAKNSNISQKMEAINRFTKKWISTNSTRSREVITLPIVVHVLWYNEEQNISEEQILSQIEVLNMDFRKLNANFNLTPSGFQTIAADTEIEFCLASKDPNGNFTNGITRTETDVEVIGETERWYENSEGGKDAWDVNSYINIWVLDIGEDLLGFATPPGTAEPVTSDGLVIGHQYFGTIGTAQNSEPNNLGRTATHEMGHYLNLEHLWGPDDGGCNEDDFVADTPTQDWESEACPQFPSYDDCSFSGDGLNFNNYMDYTDDACMTMFTEGQKLRMLAAISGPRVSLLNSDACAPSTSVADNTAFTDQLEIYPNPASHSFSLKIKQLEEARKWRMKIIDLSGNLVHQSFANQVVDISHLPDGLYLVVMDGLDIEPQKLIIFN